jgi:hypothetical protein
MGSSGFSRSAGFSTSSDGGPNEFDEGVVFGENLTTLPDFLGFSLLGVLFLRGLLRGLKTASADVMFPLVAVGKLTFSSSIPYDTP